MNTTLKKIIFSTFGEKGIKCLKDRYARLRINKVDDAEMGYMRLLKKYIIPNSIVLDIGANIGHWSKFVLKYLDQNGKVYSFEPFHESFRILVKNINDPRVTFFNLALSDKISNVDILYDPLSVFPPEAAISYTANQFKDQSKLARSEIISITLDTLEKLFHKNISFIKIDVEGHELQVVQGGFSIIKKNKPTIFMEILREKWLESKPGNSEVTFLLKEIGYKMAQLQKNKIEFDNKMFNKNFENFLFIYEK